MGSIGATIIIQTARVIPGICSIRSLCHPLILLCLINASLHGELATVQTVHDLTRLSGTNAVLVTGRNGANDGGGGLFYYREAITLTNSGTRFRHASLTGIWERVLSSPASFRWYWGGTSENQSSRLGEALREHGTVLLPAGIYRIAEPLFIAATNRLIFEAGAVLQIEKGVTVTNLGSIEAGLQQIFSGEGLVKFAPGWRKNTVPLIPRTDMVPVTWFGADSSSQEDSTKAFRRALAIRTGPFSPTIYVPPGQYKISDTLPLPSITEILGEHFVSSLYFEPIEPNKALFEIAPGANACSIKNLRIAHNSKMPGSIGILSRGNKTNLMSEISVEDSDLRGFETGMLIDGNMYVRLEANRLFNNRTALLLTTNALFSCNGLSVRNCRFGSNQRAVNAKRAGAVSFDNCFFEANEGEDTVRFENSSSIQIKSSYFEANKTGSSKGNAVIHFSNCHSVTVADCLMDGVKQNRALSHNLIALTDGSQFADLRNNRLYRAKEKCILVGDNSSSVSSSLNFFGVIQAGKWDVVKELKTREEILKVTSERIGFSPALPAE
ncbi:MAG: hypothetical protein SFY81_10495 [Verrucomicrobiota bacterium]|nr:hypothetical protein [Verrucomicrobiota bacterium]